MIQSTAYCLSGAENSKLVISHDELRVLFNQIESEFCQSDIYQKAFNGLQKRLGNAPKWIHPLIKAVGREAIRLTLRQIVCQYHSEQYQREQCHEEQHRPNRPSPHRDSSSHLDSHVETTAATAGLSSSNSDAEKSPAASVVVKTDIPAKQIVITGSTTSVSATDLKATELTDLKDQQETRHASEVTSQVNATRVEAQPNGAHPPRAIAPSPVVSNPKSASDTVPGQALDHGNRTPTYPEAHVHRGDHTSVSPTGHAPSHADQSKATFSARKRSHAANVHPEVEQVFKDIGAALRKARLEHSLTIRDIHERTRVGLHQIEAIEEGNLERLPEEIYVKGFIRQIALVVGLDYSTLTERLPQTTLKNNVVPHWHVNSRSTASKQNSFRPAHLYLGYAALMASAAGGLVWVNQSQSAAQIDSLDMPLDIPQIIDDITSILQFDQRAQHRSQAQRSSTLPGAIANPEIVTVESSISR